MTIATVVNNVKKLVVGIGEIRQLSHCCQELGIRQRVLVITDPGLVKPDLLGKLLEVLTESDIEPVIYSKVTADPSEAVLLDAIQQAITHAVEGVIGFGGGSSLDVAKMVALLGHKNTKDKVPDCYGLEQAKGSRLPLIQIPTTMGTGSEVTPVAIITTGKTTKNACVSPVLLADTVILDAGFTETLPNHIAAATGIDAMVHALEAYTSKYKKNPISDGLAKQALQLLNDHILQATAETVLLPAREQMLVGAMLAGQSFAIAPVAAVHALAYPLGGHFHIPHGNSNALVLTEVMRFNLSEAQSEYAQLARLLLPEEGDKEELAQANALIEHFSQLIEKLNVPTRLSDYGITAKDLDMLADDVMQQTRLLQNNPRIVSRQDAYNIYKALL